MIIPAQSEEYEPTASPETAVEDFNSHTYEDILATAILNKVLESCDGKRPQEVTIEVSHDVTSTDTDSGMSGGVKESSHIGSEGSEERSLTPPPTTAHPALPPALSPDQGVETEECWAPDTQQSLQFKIEEHIEEVTTHHHHIESASSEDSDNSVDPRSTKRQQQVIRHSEVAEDALVSGLSVALPDPNTVVARRVSFPELGADIVQDNYSDGEGYEIGPGDMVVEGDQWEDNWLFRRSRLVGAEVHDAVTMLIPNPEAQVQPTVGNRDVDELSELSEQQSLCSGEIWSTSESEGEGEAEGQWSTSQGQSTASKELSALAGEIVAEFTQQDQEYTVDYSVLSRVRPKHSPQPPTSPHKQPHSPPHSHSPTYPHLQTLSSKQHYTKSHSSAHHYKHPHMLAYGHSPTHMNTLSGATGNVKSPNRNGIEGSRSPGLNTTSEFSDSERPIPKPRKLSLASKQSSHKSSSPGSPSKVSSRPSPAVTSPAEDLTILSPPLDVPSPDQAPTESPTVWFLETPEDCSVSQGRILRLSCRVNSKRPMGLSWYHNGVLVGTGGGGQDALVWRQGPYHHLYIYNCTPAATTGTIAAAAYSANHCVWAFCSVECKASNRAPRSPTFTKGLSDTWVKAGGELTLQCQVQGHPEPKVIFSRAGHTFHPTHLAVIESDQYGTWTLQLRDCSVTDTGEFTATATNPATCATTRCYVAVIPEGGNCAAPLTRHQDVDINKSCSGYKKQTQSKPGGRQKHPSSHISSQSSHTSSVMSYAVQGHHRHHINVDNDIEELEDIQQVPTIPGTIAEREHLKWASAIHLPNNPYAPDRLAQRLSHTRLTDNLSSSHHPSSVTFSEEAKEEELDPSLKNGIPPRTDLHRYSRDYYIPNNPKAPRQKLHHKILKAKSEEQPDRSSVTLNGHHSSPAKEEYISTQEVCINVNKQRVPDSHTHNQRSHITKLAITPVESSRPSHWKDELKDIQTPRVEREVAKLQRTINETQRRWKESYARHGRLPQPGGTLSDSAEVLHNPRPDICYLPPRRDLWRTVSVDTLPTPAPLQSSLHPFSRHTSVDNLRLSAKLSNNPHLAGSYGSLSNINNSSCDNVRSSCDNVIGSCGNLNTGSSIINNSFDNLNHSCSNINSSYCNINSSCGNLTSSMSSVNNRSNPKQRPHSLYAMGSVSSEAEEDSDAQGHASDKSPALPSVRMLASKFDRHKVNNLDKNARNSVMRGEGISGRTTFTNNLNHRTEKTYIAKEVHSLTARSVPLRFREGLRCAESSSITPLSTTTMHHHQDNFHNTERSPSHTSTTTIQLVSHPTHSHQPGPTSSTRGFSTTVHLNSDSLHLFPGRDAPSPEHLGIPWAPAAIPSRPTHVPGDTSDDSSVPSASPRRVPRRRSLGRRDHPGCHLPYHHLSGSLTDPPLHLASDSYC